MKIVVTLIRILVGALFVFSGLVKANDPLGLAYKMEEFFQVWAGDGYLPSLMHFLDKQSLLISVGMIILEVWLGFALLMGLWKRITLWLLLLLTIFFTFLTSYVLFSGKIRACGCFGDCIPLTPMQTFTKDIILVVFILFLLRFRGYIQPLWGNTGAWITGFAALATGYMQIYVLRNLPFQDCLPYQPGNNLIELRKMPKNAVFDQYNHFITYEKNGEKKEFPLADAPDSSWTYVSHRQVLVKKGSNNVPLINDFNLKDSNHVDLTETVLNTPGRYYLFFVHDIEKTKNKWLSDVDALNKLRIKLRVPLFVVTPQPEKAHELLNTQFNYQIPVLQVDGVAFKTAARTNPTLFLMDGPVVQKKIGAANIHKAVLPQ
jgi:uncharacterized membrane protein YphA (DoxX/SURF4 family)